VDVRYVWERGNCEFRHTIGVKSPVDLLQFVCIASANDLESTEPRGSTVVGDRTTRLGLVAPGV